MHHEKTRLEDPRAVVDMGPDLSMVQGAVGEVELRGLLDRIRGFHGRAL